MKQAISFLIVLLAIIPAFGRDIKGRILDENKAPLDFVNVVLYCDSTYVAGGISDAEGNFTIPAATDCDLTAKVSFVGYETVMTNVPQSGEMGVITLRPSTVALGEVVVKATRPATTMKGNALVTDVAGSSLAIAGTANDVLMRVPMVVDNGGTIEVFGKGAPAIYINGRKVNDLQELSQLNSGDIKNVEVITNP
ncbi:MAG: carboxypeptidase-like regulatory domain-containing protein, partial [Pseudoflavonifractor sp.]|nr:carboxypeptidase-like regulatory domain-containing protein [Pseudoflavonifractor sp.]